MEKPLCPYFGECGGCTAQHIPYDLQLENKKQRVLQATGEKEITVFAGEPYHYRNRMDFIFHLKGLGLRRKEKWWSIVDIAQCPIANEKLNELLREVHDFFKDEDVFDMKKNTGTLRYAVIRTPSLNSSISFVLNEESNRLGETIEKIKAFAPQSKADHILVTYVAPNTDQSVSENFFVIKGEGMLKEKYKEMTFVYSPQGFFQNNTLMAEKMHEYLRSYFSLYHTSEAKLIDLYGGVGCFGMMNADLFKEVIIIENNKESIKAAVKNKEENKLANVHIREGDAKQIPSGKEKTFVITDPPRSGMDPKTVQRLRECKPEVLIYISCNINQLEKDLKKFPEYVIKNTALFDLFPQTPHMETIVILERKDTQKK
ncbi:23S rRNA (uracil(1939)-C(5))-methyltransferase RlmD [Candidatus Woesearchaeota archaeon]|nr:23S rRNA (uracil(1939)-C(5))-methyltransferase RlmD [Candidatus Woesearchaeota archaeon]